MIERRTATRFPVNWQIQVERSAGSHDSLIHLGVLRNISSSGALLALPVLLATGTQLDVYIKLPLIEKKWMRYPAFVVRIEQGATAVAYAVRFASPRPEFSVPDSTP